jgi:uncharacterized membrane protein YhaH (DUF805 family)
METLKYGLQMTAIPFVTIILLTAIWWALVDLSVKKVKGRKRALWTLLVILLPPIGTLLYNLMHKEEQPTAAN